MEEAPWDWQGGDHTISPLLATLLTLTPVGPTQGRMLLAPITAKSPLQRWEGGFLCAPPCSRHCTTQNKTYFHWQSRNQQVQGS